MTPAPLPLPIHPVVQSRASMVRRLRDKTTPTLAEGVMVAMVVVIVVVVIVVLFLIYRLMRIKVDSQL